jgi:hypothetical protein
MVKRQAFSHLVPGAEPYESGNVTDRAVLDKSPNHSVSSPCRLLIEASYAL